MYCGQKVALNILKGVVHVVTTEIRMITMADKNMANIAAPITLQPVRQTYKVQQQA
jgi:hypothetical protein